MSTWSNARDTLGQGIPQEGAPFDNSAQLRQMQTTVASAAPGDKWTGTAAEGYAEANSKQARVLGQMAGLDQRLGAEVDRSAAVVAAGRQNLDGVKQWVLDAAAAVPQSDQREQQLLPIARKGIGDVADVVKQTHGDLNAIGGRIQAIGNEYKELGGPSDKDRRDNIVGDDPPYDTGSEIPVGKDPKDVNKWWNSLPTDKKQQLLHDWPEKLGNLNGIPVADRSAANTAVMNQDINRVAEVAQARGVTVDQVLAHPDQYGMGGPMMDRYNNALKVKEALDADHLKTGAPTFLQVYQPEEFKGDGRAAIAIGDPDKAPNTAVVVPGTGNSVTNGWLGSADATELYNDAHRADIAHNTAVVAWMGYDAPDAPWDPRIGTTGLAHQGGQLLASDVNALNVTHEGNGGHMTVLGHSYGSTTVADAAAGYGMHADDVVLVGCPGTDLAHSADDFHLNQGGHLYVGAASSDPITQLGHIPQIHVPGTDFTASLGDDPAMDGYGSVRFKAEVPSITWPFSDHSYYYHLGSESLLSMADIASGHGGGLQHDGMTAKHRVEILGQEMDPELFRPGTSGLFNFKRAVVISLS